jgi:hypothetical protein
VAAATSRADEKMQLYIVNRAKLVYGAHATTMAINDYIAKRIGDYGPAIETACITVVYPSRSRRRKTPDPFADHLQRVIDRAPRATFYRQKQRVELLCLCRGVSGERISGDGHLNFDETSRLVATVSDALEMIRPKLRPADDFDLDAFLDDARDALARCPKALKRWLE